MAASLLHIEQQAAQLSPDDRAKLAEFLLESLQEPALSEIEEDWAQEVTARIAAHEAGQTSSSPAAAIFAEARQRLQ